MSVSVETKQINRRKSARRRPRSSVKVECRKGSTGLGPNLTFNVLDLSDTGVRLIVKQPFDDQAEVEIIISSFGMKDPIKRLGNVRWLVKLENGLFCTGIEFQKRLVYRDWQILSAPN